LSQNLKETLQLENLGDKVQTLISFHPLNKMLRCVEIILLVEFFKYLESFSMTSLSIIWHKEFGLIFIESPCIYTCTPILKSNNSPLKKIVYKQL